MDRREFFEKLIGGAAVVAVANQAVAETPKVDGHISGTLPIEKPKLVEWWWADVRFKTDTLPDVMPPPQLCGDTRLPVYFTLEAKMFGDRKHDMVFQLKRVETSVEPIGALCMEDVKLERSFVCEGVLVQGQRPYNVVHLTDVEDITYTVHREVDYARLNE